MSFISDLMGLGIPDQAAGLLAAQTATDSPTRTVSSTIIAAGTVIGDATALTSFINIVSTTASGTGVNLPTNLSVGQMGIIQNNGANALNVWPHSSSGTINGGSAGAAVTTAVAAGMVFVRASSTNWLCYVVAKEA